LAFSLSLLSFQEGFFLTALICFSGFWSDVMMSAIKRGLGIKDYGQTLKGHGGLLDRIDSLLLALPLAYISLHYLS
jgi:phosphatidate cytidylyltransferase